MEVKESVFVEVLVDGNGHIVTNAEDSTEGIGAQAQVGMLTHVFKGLTFFLHRIVRRAGAQYFNLCSLYLAGLSGSRALGELSVHAETGSGGDLLEKVGIETIRVGHHLNVFNC